MDLKTTIILLITGILAIIIAIILFFYLRNLKKAKALESTNVQQVQVNKLPDIKDKVEEKKPEEIVQKKEENKSSEEIPQRLKEWVSKAREHGYDDKKIESLLSTYDWDLEMVKRALQEGTKPGK